MTEVLLNWIAVWEKKNDNSSLSHIINKSLGNGYRLKCKSLNYSTLQEKKYLYDFKLGKASHIENTKHETKI